MWANYMIIQIYFDPKRSVEFETVACFCWELSANHLGSFLVYTRMSKHVSTHAFHTAQDAPYFSSASLFDGVSPCQNRSCHCQPCACHPDDHVSSVSYSTFFVNISRFHDSVDLKAFWCLAIALRPSLFWWSEGLVVRILQSSCLADQLQVSTKRRVLLHQRWFDEEETAWILCLHHCRSMISDRTSVWNFLRRCCDVWKRIRRLMVSMHCFLQMKRVEDHQVVGHIMTASYQSKFAIIHASTWLEALSARTIIFHHLPRWAPQ